MTNAQPLNDFFQGSDMTADDIASIAAEIEQKEAQLQLEYQVMQAAEDEQFYQDHPEYTYETWK